MKERPMVTKLKQKILKEYPEIKLKDFKIPLTNGQPSGTIKDILEPIVDEKYYVDPARYNNMDIQDIIDSKFTRNK